MKLIWYAIRHNESGKYLKDNSNAVILFPNKEVAYTEYADWLIEDDYRLVKIEQEIIT